MQIKISTIDHKNLVCVHQDTNQQSGLKSPRVNLIRYCSFMTFKSKWARAPRESGYCVFILPSVMSNMIQPVQSDHTHSRPGISRAPSFSSSSVRGWLKYSRSWERSKQFSAGVLAGKHFHNIQPWVEWSPVQSGHRWGEISHSIQDWAPLHHHLHSALCWQ